MKIIVISTLVVLIKSAPKCQRTQLFSFGARFKSTRLIEPPWDEHIAVLRRLGSPFERETFAHVMRSQEFKLLIEGYMLTNLQHKMVSFYHLMGKSKNKVAHFFYKRWPKERIVSRMYVKWARECKIKRPIAEKNHVVDK
ncbi:hypothetical protein RB195_005954 [Necator americanus]|uniref:Uncharacterized protein n=1 Tax=Necator americanus TaxID=51031 RepID=A0ABR1BQC8_NECAM